MRTPFRLLAGAFMAVGIATCTDAPSLAPRPAHAPGLGRFALAPVFSKAAAAVYAQRAIFPGVSFDRVRVVLVRPPSDTVADTTAAFAPTAQPLTLDFTVTVHATGEVFKATVTYLNGLGAVYRGDAAVTSYAPNEAAPAQQEIVVLYVGVGANAARVAVTPKTATVQAPNTATLSATAFDAASVAIAAAPIAWSTSDPTVATVTAAGVVVPTGKRGTVTIAAQTPTGISDNAAVTVTLPPASIALVSGGGQTGKAGAALAQPGVVRVLASDGEGVAGVSVNFAAPSGGAVGGASVTTDAGGQATTTLRLGSAAGPQSFVASAISFSVSIPATATAGDPAVIVAVSGGGQRDTVRKALPTLLVARVTDQFGNAVAGTTVTWARTAGAGVLGGPTSVTNGDGQASMGYTLGSTPGIETISATATAVATGATFSVTAISSGPASIAAVSGTGQTARVSQPLTAPFVVRVLDEAGTPVSGVVVSWVATNGTLAPTTTTDASGQAPNTLTAGTVVGSASATATVSTPTGAKSVSFTATVQPGIVAKLAYKSQPANGVATTPLTPPIRIELLDAAGNLTAAANGVTIALGANGSGATLGGTLTRTSAGGVASFDNLTFDKVGTGYTLVVSSSGLPSVTSAAFDIVAATASTLQVVAGDNQSAGVGTAVTVPPSVRVVDPSGNPVASVAVTFTVATGNGTVVPTTPIATNAQGVATVTSWTLGTTAGPQTVVASATGIASVTFHATAQGGSPNRLGVVTQPSPTAHSGVVLAVQPVVQLQDGERSAIAQSGVAVTAALASGSGDLGGTLTVTTDATGRATFTNLQISGTGTFTLAFTGASVTSATSASIEIEQVTASAVQVAAGDNQSAAVGTAVTVPPSARVVDASGNPVAGIAVTFVASTGSGTVVPTTPVMTNAQGIATATSWTLGATVGTQTIAASATGLEPVTFHATAQNGATSKVALVAQPASAAQNAVAFTSQPIVQLQDANGNAIAQSGIAVTAAIASGSGVLGGTVMVPTDDAGRAAFTNLSIRGTAGTFTLGFTGASLAGATSASIALAAGTPVALAFVQQPTNGAAGAAFAPVVVVAVKDADGNTVTTTSNSVTMTILAGTGTPGATLTGTPVVSASGGVATFTGVSVDRPGVNYRITFAVSGLSSITSVPFTVAVSAPGSLTIVAGNDQYYPNGWGQTKGGLIVSVKDAAGAPISGVAVTFAPGTGMRVNASGSPLVSATGTAGTAQVNASVVGTPATGSIIVSAPGYAPLTFNVSRPEPGNWQTSCALTTVGAAYCWGENAYGTVGDGTTTMRSVPTAVLGGLTFTRLAVGWDSHMCGLTSGGQAYCWGRNTFGQLGDNTTTDRSQPVAVQGGRTFASITTANYATCGLTTGAQLYCWGWVASGMLGDTERGTIRTVPALVNTGGRTFVKVGMQNDFFCGIEAGGTLSCWGNTPEGLRVAPTPVTTSAQFAEISSGGFDHICALTTAGAAMCWGYTTTNDDGELGDGTLVPHATPGLVAGGLTFAEIRTFSSNSCGRTTANRIYCWGRGEIAQIGDGFEIDRLTPVPVVSGHTFSSIFVGGVNHVCAMATNGQPFCWGASSSGQLGGGLFGRFPTPTPVKWVEGTAGAPASVVLNSVSTSTAAPGAVTSPLPSVLVRDYAGNPAVGAAVTFAVTSGGGSITGGTAVTNSSGIATVGSWTLGPNPGTNTLTATITNVAQIVFTGFATGGVPGVTIASIDQTVCSPTCVTAPVNLSATKGQIDLTVNVQANSQTMQSVTATLACPASTLLSRTQTIAAGGSFTFNLNTAEYNAVNGVPALRNGACTLTASATSTGGTTNTNTPLTLTNPDGAVLTSAFAAAVSAEGISQFTSSTDGAGMTWRAGSPMISAMLVLYSGRLPASVSITVPGAVVPMQTATTPVNNLYSLIWSATATSASVPNVTGLTIVDASGCVAPAVPPACGALEPNGITPKGVTPLLSLLDTQNNTTNLVVINSSTANANFRIDNTPPEAPLAFNIPTFRSGWVGSTYGFTGSGAGANNVNADVGFQNFISCGDGPNVTADPYVCRPQIGVSASANGQVGVGAASSNGLVSFAYYARPAAGYSPVSSNATSTSSVACDITGWTKITTAGQLPASAQNDVYVVRVFERDRLGNARCTDLTVPTTTPTLGTIINTGVAGRFGPANQGRFGVDVVNPNAALIGPSTDPTAAGANQLIGAATASTPFFKITASDNESGLRNPAAPVSTFLQRLAIDPSTGVASTPNSQFGCPIGFNLTTGLCSSPAFTGMSVVVDASSATGGSSNTSGYYNFSAVVQDLAFNTSVTLTRSVLVDRVFPVGGGITIPATLIGGQPATFATSATDDLDLFFGEYGLSYPVNPSGNPLSTQNLPIHTSAKQLGTSFDNVLTTSIAYDAVIPFFTRSIATTTGHAESDGSCLPGQCAPQNNGGSGLPSSIVIHTYDAAFNITVTSAVIPAANVPQTGRTDFTVAPPSGDPAATMISFAVSNAVRTVSNCPTTGCVGGQPTVNPTSITLTARASGNMSSTYQFANPFSRVEFYYLDQGGEYSLIGTATAPSVTDNATVRSFTWATVTPFNPSNSHPTGPLHIIAIGVSAQGDGLVTPVNSNITTSNP